VCDGLKILTIFPLSMHSHLRIGHSIAVSLLDAGHEVTAITGLQNQKPRDNYRVIQMPDFMEKFKGELIKNSLSITKIKIFHKCTISRVGR
jgi:hypothetical protein